MCNIASCITGIIIVVLFNTEENDLSAVHSAVSSISATYTTLATQLGLPPGTAERVMKECNTVSERLQKILLEWLRRNYDTKRHGLPSWRMLCVAVASEAGGSNRSLASVIAAQHPSINGEDTDSTGTVLYM